ncbi:hypothetical protein AC1031_003303 [Aphanomyces cochlioides]|nr:hypothetical protein AC1031_003303 [Aphanomyces cochlioides]
MWESKATDANASNLPKKGEADPAKSNHDGLEKRRLVREQTKLDEAKSNFYHESSMAMALPEPYVSQVNTKFLVVEDIVQLTTLVASQPFDVQPLGYYKSPDGFDIYVFECGLGSNDTLSNKKRWKIHRRYRHFDMFLSRMTELSPSVRYPSLSGSYLQMFRAKHCKERLVELHGWLSKTVELLQKTPSTPDLLVQLCCFLFAGANTPYADFASLPAFAWANEEINIRLSGTPIYPSKVRSSIETDAGLGIRLVPSVSRMEEGGIVYRGAMVHGFLRDQYDNNVQYLRLGAKLSFLNGVSVEDEDFQTILLHLRNLARPMHLTFTYDRHPRSTMSESDLERHNRLMSIGSAYSQGIGSTSSMDATELQTPMNVLGSVLNETFGRRRTETISISLVSDELDNQDDHLESWDEIGSFFMDTITVGFFSYLSLDKPKSSKDAAGIWSSPSGPMSILLTACKLRGRDAVFLSVNPQMFQPTSDTVSVSRRNKKPEMRLERGMVLTSVNNKTTFGLSFQETLRLIENASQPTSLCFRWFNEYSVFISPDIDAADQPRINRPSSVASEREAFPTEAEVACLVAAHTRMSASLQQALVENASLRNEIKVVQESNRLLREDNEAVLAAYKILSRDSNRLITRCNDLQQALAEVTLEVQQTGKERSVAEKTVLDSESKIKKQVAIAVEASRKVLKEHEARFIEESRKSVEVAKRAADARAKRQVEEALAALRRQNNIEMQRLAEDNGEEIEFLNQQVALWKHQVEVMTENDRRDRSNDPMSSMSDDDLMFMDEEQDRRAGARLRSASRGDDNK